jgi:class 3 adenylate cyclase/tetratricopeptide (TPR) repeat protein
VAVFTTEERRVVTILFADLVRSTELAARLDPERFREVMAAFFRAVSEELESLRGRAEKFIGDAVMAVWGLPHAHDDDGLRAVRAGFAIRHRMERLAESLALPMPLRVRVGVNTGPVAAGSGPADQFLMSGAAVNLAVRLEEAAEPDEILVGETTWQLTQHAVEYGAARSVAARGFPDDVKAWPAVALSPRSTRRTIPLVGRRSELAILVDTFERVRKSGPAHLLTVLGEPGIGKSRLVDEFVAGLDDEVKILSGGASDFEEDVTFAPLAEMILRELGVDREAPAAVVRERLHEVVSGCCDPSDVDRVVFRLGLALGLGLEERERDPERVSTESLARFEEYVKTEGRERHRYRTAEVRAGFQQLLEGLAGQGPVVVVLEDLQLARPDLLDVVEHVVRSSRRLPLLVVAVARDELLDHRPGWAGGIADAVTMRLDPLEPDEAKELAIAAGESLDDPTAERIARQAGGNPFFIVETTGMLLQRHEAHDVQASHSHLLPLTVQAVVSSRIDHLEDDARDLLRKASVFGRSTFSTWELSQVTEPNPELIRTLEEEEFLVRDPDREGVWRFRHDMLRDVAYESLAKRDRQRFHVQVAEAIERSNESDRYPQAIAFHLEQAARASLDLNPRDRSLPDRAVKALARAGDVARWRMESRTAIDLYQRALALAGPEDGWGRREARILSSAGEARYWLGEFEQAKSVLQQALAIGGPDPWTRTHANRFLADVVLNAEGDPGKAGPIFDEAMAGARELNDPFATARTLLMAGWVPYWRGDLEGARRMFEEALEISRDNRDPDGDAWGEARALVALTSVISPIGNEEEALQLGRRALELGREMGDPFTVAVALENVGNSLRKMMRLDEALPLLDESVRIFRELDARWELASTLGDRGELHWLEGRLAEAEGDLREALDLCRKLGERSLIGWTAAQLAIVLMTKGDVAGARRILEHPSARVGADTSSDISVASAEALLAVREGRRDHAVELAQKVLTTVRSEGWRNPMAARVWWVGRVFDPDLVGGSEAMEEARRTLEAARWLHTFAAADLVRGTR